MAGSDLGRGTPVNGTHVRVGGRGGGYKEIDEEELEETKGRRKEAEEDDGELYDEFGNLKKKFRAKSQQAEVTSSIGAERAGWEVEELEMEGRRSGTAERRRDHVRCNGRNRERDERNRRRGHSRERDRGLRSKQISALMKLTKVENSGGEAGSVKLFIGTLGVQRTIDDLESSHW